MATKLTFLGRKVRQFEIQSKPGRYLFYRPPGTGACLGPAISAFEGLRGEKNVHIFFLIRKNWRYQHTPGLDHPETFRQNHMCCIHWCVLRCLHCYAVFILIGMVTWNLVVGCFGRWWSFASWPPGVVVSQHVFAQMKLQDPKPFGTVPWLETLHMFIQTACNISQTGQDIQTQGGRQ